MNYSTNLWISSLCQQGVGRENLEDCVFVRNYTHERYAILGVTDGMGGLEMGETASSDICRQFNALIEKHPEQELKNRAITANSLLYKRKEKQGATISTVIIDKKESLFFGLSIGDSRIYKYHNLKLNQLSVDDTPSHHFSPANVITNAIGLRESINNLNIISGETVKGDSWLLSTDGIHSFVQADDIRETIQLYKKHSIVGELTKQALARGSKDDMTTIFCVIM